MADDATKKDDFVWINQSIAAVTGIILTHAEEKLTKLQDRLDIVASDWAEVNGCHEINGLSCECSDRWF